MGTLPRQLLSAWCPFAVKCCFLFHELCRHVLSWARLCYCKTKTHFIAILLGEMLFCVKHHSVVSGEDDDDLYASLARARKAAEKPQKGSSVQDPFAEQLASRRDQDEAEQAMDTDKPAGMLILGDLLVGSYFNRELRGGPEHTHVVG